MDQRFWSKVDKTGTCWPWQASKTEFGYGKYAIGNGRWELAHRVVWQLTYGTIPAGMCVLHGCDVPACVYPLHLRLGTKSDNARDMVTRKRNPNRKGEANPRSKLTPLQVGEIRTAVAFGQTDRVIAAAYSITPANVRHIRNGRTWKVEVLS